MIASNTDLALSFVYLPTPHDTSDNHEQLTESSSSLKRPLTENDKLDSISVPSDPRKKIKFFLDSAYQQYVSLDQSVVDKQEELTNKLDIATKKIEELRGLLQKANSDLAEEKEKSSKNQHACIICGKDCFKYCSSECLKYVF